MILTYPVAWAWKQCNSNKPTGDQGTFRHKYWVFHINEARKKRAEQLPQLQWTSCFTVKGCYLFFFLSHTELAINEMGKNKKYFSFMVPAWSHIWASVIQGCRGPCLGALLCRDEATSDSACSTLEAAIEVAWIEPVQVILKNYISEKE